MMIHSAQVSTFQRLIIAALVSGVFCLTAGQAVAHRVNVFAWVAQNTVHVESKFSGGKKVKNGKILVKGPGGDILHTGQTNMRGEYTFQLPDKAPLTIIIEAGSGHRGEWTLATADLPSPAVPDNKKPDMGMPAEPESQNLEGDPSSPGLSEQAIERAIEKALDKKLSPVLKSLADSRQIGPTAKDVFAGIGYILGVVGIVTYWRSRKGKN
jgi:nickel transport protein